MEFDKLLHKIIGEELLEITRTSGRVNGSLELWASQNLL